jgi:polysaccharide pyruvyl transferase WcaK-like protein
MLRIGLFGLLGSGNIGNDASLEAVVAFLRAHHPDAAVDAMCGGPERVSAEYAVPAVHYMWYHRFGDRVSGLPAFALRPLGKGIDTIRTATWVRRHDVVIVPGMGVLETTLPMRAWGFPFSLLVLSASGRLFGTKIALVSVGASEIRPSATKWVLDAAARLAAYRSYRDALSRTAMQQRGLDVSRDQVYPDLVFSLPSEPFGPGDPAVVGVGVMAYQGSNDDRKRAAQIRAVYLDGITRFVCWLADNARQVRLLTGDNVDETAVEHILSHLRESRPDLAPGQVTARPITSFADLVSAMAPVGIVVATRYHNVLCALKLGKPTISVGYAEKNDELMAAMGLAEFCQSARSLDADLLIKQFAELESRAAQLQPALAERSLANAGRLGQQFAVLSELLIGAGEPAD